MSSRKLALLGLSGGAVVVLGAQSLGYGLVYPAAAAGSKLPVALAIVFGLLGELLALAVCWRALRRSELASERFFATLALVLSCFFMFVVLFGYGIPGLVLGVKD